jgi:hypothetical protein
MDPTIRFQQMLTQYYRPTLLLQEGNVRFRRDLAVALTALDLKDLSRATPPPP